MRISLTPTQAAELAGMIVLDRTTPFTYPRVDLLKYDSAVLFPIEGSGDAVYLADDAGVFYRWVNNEYAPMSGGVDAEELVSLLIVTELTGNETEDTKAPSAKAVYDTFLAFNAMVGSSFGAAIEALEARVTALEG